MKLLTVSKQAGFSSFAEFSHYANIEYHKLRTIADSDFDSFMKILNDTSRKFKKEAPKGATHRCEGDWFKYGIHGWVFWWDGVEWVKSTKTKLPNNSRIR